MRVRINFIIGLVLLSLLMMGACQPTATTTNIPEILDETVATVTTNDAVVECANTTADALSTAGQQVYSDTCAGCHGQQGEGQASFPALAGNPSLSSDDVVSVVQGFLNLEVHPFLADMTTDDIAAVLTYIRGSFGNSAAPICPELIPAQ